MHHHEPLQHAVRIQSFGLPEIRRFFIAADSAAEIHRRDGDPNLLAGHSVVMGFYKPSTRTHASFGWVFRHQGAQVLLDPENPEKTLSLSKGETLPDTVRVLEGIGHDPAKTFFVFRHEDHDFAEAVAAATTGSHVFNAGCGKVNGFHPTQACQDGRAIFVCGRERGLVSLDTLGEKGLAGGRKPFRYVAVGDLRNGRTVRAGVYFLAKCFPWIEFYFASPDTLMIGKDILAHLDENGVKYHQTCDPAEFRAWTKQAHVLYVTRIQKEDLGAGDLELFDQYQQDFCVDMPLVSEMKPEALIMHPLPRNKELAVEVDKDPRAIYLTDQLRSGPISRLALAMMMRCGY
jgi:aspartate carbamoyltransferase catalytic subunit